MTILAKEASRILEVGFGFCRAKVLLSAIEFNVFTLLSARSMTGEELGEAINLHPRGIWDFFDALVSLGFLEREGNGRQARYRNTAATAYFLDKNKSTYIGSLLEYCNNRSFRFWGDLESALKTGQPQNETKQRQMTLFDALYEKPTQTEQFADAMRVMSRANFDALLEKFDFSKYKTLCDVGGGKGLLSCLVAKRYPMIECINFDLPQVEPFARKEIEKENLSERVRAASGDFFNDKLPAADIITMSMILHDWNLEKKKHLIRLAYEALPEDGAFIAIENLIDDERRKNTAGPIMSLGMLIEFGEAFDFTGADFWGWCQEAGFRRYEVINLTGAGSAAIAYK